MTDKRKIDDAELEDVAGGLTEQADFIMPQEIQDLVQGEGKGGVADFGKGEPSAGGRPGGSTGSADVGRKG